MSCENQCGESSEECILEFATPLKSYRLADDSSVELEIAKAVIANFFGPSKFRKEDFKQIGVSVAEAILAYRGRIDEAEEENEV